MKNSPSKYGVTIDHVMFNCTDFARSRKFYEELCTVLGGEVRFDHNGFYGISIAGTLLCISSTPRENLGNGFSQDNPGACHLCFGVRNRELVDEFHREFLASRPNIVMYGGPRDFPQYGESYYAVFFTDPDGVQLEVAITE